MTGFTYNGVHCSEFGLYYIPDRDEQWFNDPEYDVYDNDIEWRHGGVYYTSKANIRKFTIKCYFEEIDVSRRQAIKQWLRRDSKGMLFFDDMPFIYWIVRPGKIPVGNWYLDSNESHSGTVTITFNAYNPFGYLTRKSNRVTPSEDNTEAYCNLINHNDMPAEPTVSSTSFDVYNPGTECCGLTIELSGTASNPFRFYNNSNGTVCAFEGLPPTQMRLMIDGDTGYVSTYLAGSTTTENGFAYHDKGVIRLEPNFGRSDVGYTYLGKNGTMYTFELDGYEVTNNIVGAKVILSDVTNGTFTVSSVSRANNRIYCTNTDDPTVPSEGTCSVRTLNNISIQEKVNNSWVVPSTLSLSYISIDYKPRAM